jgi:dihydropyrimidinase
MKVTGWPVTTISRGHIVIENGEFKGSRSHGHFMARKIDDEIIDGRFAGFQN